MTQIVFTAADLPTIVAAAEAMGFYSPTTGIIQDGVIPNGGSWFYNFVGTISQAPGVWGRLVHNGDPSYIPALPGGSGVTLYEYSAALGGWSSDGATLAPAYVGTVGLVM